MIDAVNPDYENTPASNARPFYDYTSGDRGIPLVSIITPYYNVGEVFWETVRCIQRMSYQHLEWIIVDDGSTNPESLAQLDRLAATDTRVKVVHQTNQGPAAARNHAVRLARGRYLLQLDADDLVEPTFVEKALWLMETQPQFAACSAHNVTFGVRSFLWNHGFQSYQHNLTKENFVTSQAMIRRDAYLRAGGNDESIVHGHEDWDFWLNLADAGYWGYTIPEYLTWYRTWHHSRVVETAGDTRSTQAFRNWLLDKHAHLLKSFPHPEFISGADLPHPAISDELPFSNSLVKPAGKKRILFLLPWLRIGGADKFSLDLVRTLSQHGYEFTIVTTVSSYHSWLHEFAQITPDIFHLPNFLQYADFPRFLNYLIASRQIDAVLISGSELGYCLVPFLRAYFPNLPILDYMHVEEEHWKNGGYPWMSVRLGTQLDLSVTCTHHLKEWMVDRGADPERIRVVHANIDSSEWDPARYDSSVTRQHLRIDEDTVIILYVGRIVDQKRPLVWAEILRRLAQTERNFVGLVVGDGDRLYEMQSFVTRHRLHQQVRFLGELPNDDVRELMAASDILLLPSKYEGLALVLFEAMAMGTVPVATTFGGHPELVTPECGYLIPPSDRELDEYTDAVRRLVRDSRKRALMAAAGRKRIQQQFELDDMVDGMEQAIARASEVAAARSTAGADRDLARRSASFAIEYLRLNELSDRLWYELHVKPQLSQARSLGGLVRIVRGRILPIGTVRYEVYKRIRRTLLPNHHYDEEYRSPVSSAATTTHATPESLRSNVPLTYLDEANLPQLESVHVRSEAPTDSSCADGDDQRRPDADLVSE